MLLSAAVELSAARLAPPAGLRSNAAKQGAAARLFRPIARDPPALPTRPAKAQEGHRLREGAIPPWTARSNSRRGDAFAPQRRIRTAAP